MSNKVWIKNDQKKVKIPSGIKILVRRSCNAVLTLENIQTPCEISVSFVDNEQIAKLNGQFRNKPIETDVLSFPLGEGGVYDTNPETGALLLGDIVISLEKAKVQSEMYG
ncbi:MAG: rRNA maturation RNase YbeY, partial [Oscillospiraceae bacterium]